MTKEYEMRPKSKRVNFEKLGVFSPFEIDTSIKYSQYTFEMKDKVPEKLGWIYKGEEKQLIGFISSGGFSLNKGYGTGIAQI